MYFPIDITDKQRKSLENFRKELQDEKYTITVLSNLHRDEDGILIANQKVVSAENLKYLTDNEKER